MHTHLFFNFWQSATVTFLFVNAKNGMSTSSVHLRAAISGETCKCSSCGQDTESQFALTIPARHKTLNTSFCIIRMSWPCAAVQHLQQVRHRGAPCRNKATNNTGAQWRSEGNCKARCNLRGKVPPEGAQQVDLNLLQSTTRSAIQKPKPGATRALRLHLL